MTNARETDATTAEARHIGGPALALGVALGGFFDGILLHQILQWHHLLSLVVGVGGLRTQVLFDGLFHLLMYAVAMAAVLLLLRRRSAFAAAGAGRRMAAFLLLGFGAWHVLDAVLSHWLLGIHRIRLDVPEPLVWDLGWLAAFGVVPLLLGFDLLRRPSGKDRRGALTLILATALTLSSAVWAAQPPPGARQAIVIFDGKVSDAQAWQAIADAGGSVLWQSQGAWATVWPRERSAGLLYDRGALLVSRSLLGAACSAWAPTPFAEASRASSPMMSRAPRW